MLQYYVLREYKPFMKIVTCNYFLTYSSTSIKRPQGLVAKNRGFYHLCFFGKSSQTRSFLIFWIKKNASKTRKRKFLKKTKNRNFPKGLDHSFCQNIELFIICVFLCKSSHKRSFFGLLDKKECFLGQKKEVLKKLQ